MGLEILTFYRRNTEAPVSASPDLVWDGRKSALRLAIFILVFFLYLCAGAAMFRTIEAPLENKFTKDLHQYLKNFKDKHQRCLVDSDLQMLITKVTEANEKGLRIAQNASSVTDNWGFGQSFFFAGTLLTTVGYGHVSPVSQAGKAFTIVYCIIGIPAFLIVLNALVDRFKYPSNLLLDYFNKRLIGLYRPSFIQWLHLFTIFGLLLVFMYILPATVFTAIETDWTYLDAFYYCFISLTTIGLGDYIPGDKIEQPNRGVYKIFTTGYLIIGIICMMVFLAVLYEIPHLNLSHLFAAKEPKDGERSRLAKKDSPTTSYTRQIDEDIPPITASPIK